jgi:hypothetical protein
MSYWRRERHQKEASMTPWCAGKLIEQRTEDLAAAAGGGRRRANAADLEPGRRGRVAERLSVWCGYRMINLGSRILRPALVAGAGA